MLSALFLVLFVGAVLSYPSGAPNGSCGDRLPVHGGAKPQKNPSPFLLQPAINGVRQGERLQLMLTSQAGVMFKGYMIQAITDDGTDGAVVGSFPNISALSKTVDCFRVAENSVTHRNNSELTSLQFEWQAPDDYEGNVVFVATVVQEFSTFWAGIKSQSVSIAKRSVSAEDLQSKGISTTHIPAFSRTTTTPEPPTEATQRSTGTQVKDPIYLGCGSRKVCFGSKKGSSGCVQNGNCVGIVSVTVLGEKYVFEMLAHGSQYVAVGLSDDSKMGDDSVVECVYNPSVPSGVSAFMSWNTNEPNNTRLKNHDAIRLLNGSYVNGDIRCAFERDTESTVMNRVYNLEKNSYNLLIAAGKTKGVRLGIHDIVAEGSRQSILLSDIVIAEAPSKLLLRLHGAFMITAWIGTAGIGILLARYFKQTWVGSQFCGKDHWFVWHRLLMLLTCLLTVAAAVLIFVELEWHWSLEKNPHAILGCVTTILVILQPIGAAFRPHPDSRRRPLFNWLHWLVGNIAHIIGIVTIFFAISLSKAELPKWMDWILVGYVTFHVAVHLILSIASIASERNSSKRINSFPMKEMTSSRSPLHSSDRKQDAPVSEQFNLNSLPCHIKLSSLLHTNFKQAIGILMAFFVSAVLIDVSFSYHVMLVEDGEDISLKPVPPYLKHSCFRKFMLGLYIVVIILLVAALIVIAVFPPIETSWKNFQKMIAPSQNTTGQ